MLSALLPGVRELRTPFITGALWASCLWLLIGSRITHSSNTREFIDRYQLSVIPAPVWIGVGSVIAYLIGSLLVVRTSPFSLFRDRIRGRLTPAIDRLGKYRLPARKRYRLLWRLWWLGRHRRPLSWLHDWVDDRPRYETVDNWLRRQFRDHLEVGRVPVMRGVYRGCNGPTGFESFYSVDSVRATAGRYHDDEERDPFESFISQFIQDIKDEQPAIEARIQMGYPEVYAEIDRLKVEGELRLSIFWPLTTLIVLLAFVWTPLILALLLVPPALVVQGHARIGQATDKTWSVFTTGDVTSPLLDTMAAATGRELRDFASRDQD